MLRGNAAHVTSFDMILSALLGFTTRRRQGIGKLHTTTVRDSADAITYAEEQFYDALGRPSTLWRELPDDPFSVTQPRYFVTQTYDSVGRVLKTVYPTGFQTRNVYNTFGYLKEVRKYEAGDEERPKGVTLYLLPYVADRTHPLAASVGKR